MSYHFTLCVLVLAAGLVVPGRANASPSAKLEQAKAKAFAADKEPTSRSNKAPARDKALAAPNAKEPAPKERAKVEASRTTKRQRNEGPRARKTKVRPSGKKPAGPCYTPEVHVVRRRGSEVEHRNLSLTFCDGRANPSALDSLSVLARSRDAERPLLPEIRAYRRRPVSKGPVARRRRPGYLSEQVMTVHPGLLERLQKVAEHFKGRTIEVISGHRPDARDTSRHHHGRALDFRVDGVSREALRDFIRKFEDTGVGYYPNSYFVHMDVRDAKGYWVDRSAPGEAPDYGPWPRAPRDIERERDRVLATALSQLAELGTPIPPSRPEPKRMEADIEESDDEPSDQGLKRDEIAKIRAEALAAIKAL